MSQSDLVARIAAGIEILAVLINLMFAFVWFISMIWVLIGLFWVLVGLMALVEGAVAVFVLIKGYSPFGIAGPVIGLGVSLCNFNILFGGGMEILCLIMMIVALVLRGQEDAAA